MQNNTFIKTCAQQEIDRLSKQLKQIQKAVGNEYREALTAQDQAEILMSRLTYSDNDFVRACTAQEIERVLERGTEV